MVPLNLASVPGMRAVMLRGVRVVEVMCTSVLRVEAWVVTPAAGVAGLVRGGGGLEQTISTVKPVLSSRVRMVRRACSSRATIAPARQMY